ncbi:MAG TPA: SDR family oxidoreductase [Solirubrobacteraceae bacterium]|nr:SDR family oxidoreductase [Solirubrobacteraceae bacterium]
MTHQTCTGGTSAGGEVLLTGATGFLGTELLARYLEQDTRSVIALVRANDDRAAQRRLDATLAGALGEAAAEYRPRVQAVAADVGRPGLGLSPRKRNALAERTEVVVHCAAAVSFDQPIGGAREVNVGGTSEMLAFAQCAMHRGGLARYVHISTAFVGGTHPGAFSERDLYLGQGFRNTYEQSKCEAELLVRSAQHLPTTVLRPSIVVGDRNTGWTSAFNVIYWPLRAFAKGLLQSVPAVPSSPVDVVSVDYVADAVHALAVHPAAGGRTFNLTAGPAISSLGEIASIASSYFRQPAPRLIPPEQFDFEAVDPLRQRVFAEAAAFFPYFTTETTFDSSESQALLGPLGVRPSPLPEYLDRLLDFATRSRWGKRQIFRHEGRPAGRPDATIVAERSQPARERASRRSPTRLARSLA